MHMGDDLFRGFQELVKRQGSVRLLNSYQGIPIIQPAEVKWVDGSQVCLEVHPSQAVCMYREQRTTLLADCFAQPLVAGIERLDVLNNLAILVSFQSENASLGKRMALRIHPNPALEAVLTDGVQSFPCRLVDLSSNGAGGVVLNQDVNGQANFTRGQQVYLDLLLPPDGQSVRLQAKLVSLSISTNPPIHRIGMSLSAQGAAQGLLQSYLDARLEQTLQELEQEYEALCRKQGLA
jgi:hypothetical protein